MVTNKANKTKITLNKLIQNNLLSISFVSIPIIIFLLTSIYLATTSYFSNAVQNYLIEFELKNNKLILEKEAKLINSQLKEIETLIISLQKENEHFFSKLDKLYLKIGENKGLEELMKSDETFDFFIRDKMPSLSFAENGVLYKTIDNGGSSLYYSSDTNFNTKKYIKAISSEVLDSSFKSITENTPLVVQAYLNTWDNMNRLYPFVKNVVKQYGPILKMKDYNFYYEADSKHDPSKKPVWTKAYLDPAGQGWMVSCIIPVYNKDFLEGVVGLDITLKSFINHILNLNLSKSNNMFIIDQTGTILAMNPDIERLFNLKELKSHDYTSNIRNTILKPKEYNILKDTSMEIKKLVKNMFEKDIPYLEITLKGKKYFLNQITISQTDWKLFVLTDREVLLQPIKHEKKIVDSIVNHVLLIMIVFYIIFLIYQFKKSKQLSDLVISPIEVLSYQTQKLGSTFLFDDLVNSDIKEIDQLNENFKKMRKELNKRTNDLVKTELEKKEKIEEAQKHYINSITDSLTKLYNRLKIDEILDYEISQSERYNYPLSIIFLDIDDFKKINDTLGHEIGDEILVDIGKILKDNIRETDSIGRWGGEEFIVICTKTKLKSAAILGEKLRKIVEEHKFSTGKPHTASFGIAEFERGDTRRNLIQKADSALYEAKRSSKNIVMLYYDKDEY